MPFVKCKDSGAGAGSVFAESTARGTAAAVEGDSVGLSDAADLVPRPVPVATDAVTTARINAAIAPAIQRPRRPFHGAGVRPLAGAGTGTAAAVRTGSGVGAGAGAGSGVGFGFGVGSGTGSRTAAARCCAGRGSYGTGCQC